MKIFRNCLLTAALLLVLLLFPVNASAEEAADITDTTGFSGSGYSSFAFLKDKRLGNYQNSNGNAQIKLENASGMGSLYLLFDLEYGEYTVTNNTSGQSVTVGKHGMLHEFLDLSTLFGTEPTSVTLDFANGKVRLSEIYVFSKGQTPSHVQRWDAPLDGKADIVLFATHGDDDQLYFAGLLPYYTQARDCAVQVVYLTDHRNLTNGRTHEMLNGLWSVGVTAYPVFGRFADFRIDSLQGTYDAYLNTYGVTQEQLQSYVVEQVRRFKPQVAVGHDLKGEYGHGMHRVYADLLTKALDITNDPEQFPESAEKYGTWDIPKLYLHLYEENTIVMDYDQPMDAFDGLTPFQVTQKYGFPCHVSQQGYMFTPWLNGYNNEITSPTQITYYNPAHFGLYRTTVGPDTGANDMMENIVTYAEQERIEQERLEQERLEQERLEQERLEQERLEQERLEQERLEQVRLEQERLEQERLEQERLEQEQLAQQQKQKQVKDAIVLVVLIAVLLILVGCLVLVLMRLRSIRRHKRRQHTKQKAQK